MRIGEPRRTVPSAYVGPATAKVPDNQDESAPDAMGGRRCPDRPGRHHSRTAHQHAQSLLQDVRVLGTRTRRRAGLPSRGPLADQRQAVVSRAAGSRSASSWDTVADVSVQLMAEFEHRVELEEISQVVLGCRADLDCSPAAALPELIARLARQRLLDLASRGPAPAFRVCVITWDLNETSAASP